MKKPANSHEKSDTLEYLTREKPERKKVNHTKSLSTLINLIRLLKP